jgi:acyl-CoA thioesterase-1
MKGFTSSTAGVLFAGVFAAALATGCQGRGATSPSGLSNGPGTTTRQVVVLGDSLAVAPTRDESFPAVLQERISDLGLNWTVVNASENGDTTADGRRRVERLLGNDVGVLVLALGANDGLRRVDLDTIEGNLAFIIEKAQARGVDVLLCGMETPPRDLLYAIGFHNLFPRLASRYRIALVPFLLSGVVFNPDFNGSDLIHPNRAGAQRIAETVWTHLEPMLD